MPLGPQEADMSEATVKLPPDVALLPVQCRQLYLALLGHNRGNKEMVAGAVAAAEDKCHGTKNYGAGNEWKLALTWAAIVAAIRDDKPKTVETFALWVKGFPMGPEGG